MFFRDLKCDEIDLRVQSVKENGFILLLYKDARCDMNILDETVGNMNWQRKHLRNNANCIVSIWDNEKNIWIEKEDTGVESFTEKEKGLASDSFKRACFNWGIGRELYTAPFIWINEKKYIKNNNDKFTVYEKFIVSDIVIENKIITYIEIKDTKDFIVFSWGGRDISKKNNEIKKEYKFPPSKKILSVDTEYKGNKGFKNWGEVLENLEIDEFKSMLDSYVKWCKNKGIEVVLSQDFETLINDKEVGF